MMEGDNNDEDLNEDGQAEAGPILVQKYLKGMDYPCSRQDLVDHARDQGAPDSVIETLKQIPGRDYTTPAEVTKEIAEIM